MVEKRECRRLTQVDPIGRLDVFGLASYLDNEVNELFSGAD